MTGYKSTGISSEQISYFDTFQKKVFFPKTDLPFLFSKKILTAVAPEGVRSTVTSIFKYSLNQDVVSIKKLKRSTFHLVFLVKTNKHKYVLRINKIGEYIKALYFLKDVWLEEVLHKEKIQSPAIVAVDLSRLRVPYDFEIQEMAPGKSLFDLSKKEIHPSVFVHFGKALSAVHAIKGKGYGPLSIKQIVKSKKSLGLHVSWEEYVLQNLAIHLDYCYSIKAIDKKKKEKILRLFSLSEKLLNSVRPVLLHGDVGNHNVFSDGKEITSFIDWEDSLFGDPVFDIAFWGTGVFFKKEWFDPFMEGYGSKSLLLDDFWQRFWCYFLRIAISKTVLRYEHAYEYRGELSEKRIHLAVDKLSKLL